MAGGSSAGVTESGVATTGLVLCSVPYVHQPRQVQCLKVQQGDSAKVVVV